MTRTRPLLPLPIPAFHWMLPGLLVINAMLKFSWLGVNDLSGDEPFTVFWATRPLAEFREMLRTENNPPLYFLLIKAWSVRVPLTEAWLRVPSALFSVLTIWPLYLLARSLANRETAVVACLLFTLSNHQFGFAHEVRGYSLLLLLSVLAVRLIARRSARNQATSTVLLGLVFIALVYTHFFGWLVIALCGLCVLILPEWHDQRRRVLVASVLTVVAFLPYGFIFLQRAGESITHGTWVDPHGPEEIWHMVRRWSNQPVVTLLLLLPLVVVAIRERMRPLALRFALLWSSLPLFGLWVVQWWVPAYVDRYLLFASIGFYLATAYALVELFRKPGARWSIPGIAVGSMALTFTPWYDNEQHPSRVAAQVRSWQHAPADPPVLVRPYWYKLTLWAHLDRAKGGPLPWLQVWSEHYDDAREDGPPEGADRFILVYMAAEQDTALAPEFPGYRQVQVRQGDPQVRVALYAR